jgi:hypothetical protein
VDDTAITITAEAAEITPTIAAAAVIIAAADAPVHAAGAIIPTEEAVEDAVDDFRRIRPEKYRRRLSFGLACISRKRGIAEMETIVRFLMWCNCLGMWMPLDHL